MEATPPGTGDWTGSLRWEAAIGARADPAFRLVSREFQGLPVYQERPLFRFYVVTPRF